MKIMIFAIALMVIGAKSFAQTSDSDTFSDWKKIYNRTDAGIDETHYVYLRIQLCKHANKDGSTQHTSKYEVKYPDQLSDSTSLEGDIYFVGNKRQVVDNNVYISRDTTSSFFAVSQAEVFTDEISLPFNDLTDLYVIIRNLKSTDVIENNPLYKKAVERTKKLLDDPAKKGKKKLPKARAASLGNRG